MSLSSLGDSFSYSIFGKVAEMAARGEKVYPLAIGEPSFATPRPIVDRAYESMKKGATHYVSSYGTREVREAIHDKVRKHNGIAADLDNNMFITTKLAVYAAVLATVGSGEVLVPDPGYFYRQPVLLAGAKPVRYRLAGDFSLDMESLKRTATAKTKAIIVNTPSNPTGKVLAKAELKELLGFCQQRKVSVISDESYEDLVYEKDHVSIGSLEPEPDTVVSLFSLSKSFAMTGWRAGYAVASRPKVKLMNRFVEHTMSCFPPFIEAASAFALRKGWSHTHRFKEELRARRDMMQRMMRKIPRLEFSRAEGAFYSFPKYDAKVSSIAFSSRLLSTKGVAVLPGSIFGPAGEKHLRISFAAPRETIEGGMGLLGEFLEGLPR